ncbi:class I SAM-dependent methyltransferase [Photobacterium sp. 1_MG-2023]|uniref:class I SAM-dependent methyltransferase n=1 Tax=Photobacterium sp. 1_MG-2023 TaxID=3062646 RepID=UPI0026E27FFA|nr:class I SAM-dependent methyltransferase [Photobacterium sp. 1_MG-2023]MDO6705517.1 class I SAM-dependent methyltransferase [Photobacterium sp. 1_MG-2023]
MSQENQWEQFAQNFEARNNYVVGMTNIDLLKGELRAFSDPGRLLELGCGNGTYTQCFLDSASEIMATDISEEMVRITQERFQSALNVRVEQADCFQLPYQDSAFDTVLMANVLHIIPNPEIALAEGFRVLKAGGRLIVASFTLHGMSLIHQMLMRYRYTKMYGKKSSTAIKLTPVLASDRVSAAGFQVETCRLIGHHVKAVYLVACKVADSHRIA